MSILIYPVFSCKVVDIKGSLIIRCCLFDIIFMTYGLNAAKFTDTKSTAPNRNFGRGRKGAVVQRIAVVESFKVIITLKVTLIKPYRLTDSNAPTMEGIV